MISRWESMSMVCVAVAALAAGCSSNVAGPNRAPVAVAGPDRQVELDDEVVLDGSASSDPDGDDLNFQWELLAVPANGSASIDDPRGEVTGIRPDARGVWVVRLVVSDGRLASEPDVLQIRVGAPCVDDEDCDDGNPCTIDTCQDGTCVYQNEPEGTDCGTCAACDAEGVCADDLDQLEDCGVCQQCAPGGTCRNQPAGTDLRGECPDAVYCDGEEACDGDGACQEEGEDPCGGLTCDEELDACVGCTDDAECPVCQMCDPNGVCVNQPEGEDLKDECADDLFCDGVEACDGNGACQEEGEDPCGGLACNEVGDTCEGCLDDDDCPLCQMCGADNACIDQPAGEDRKNECADDLYCDGVEACDGNGACQEEGEDPCGALMCDEDQDACVGCMADADCPVCHRCDGDGTCVPQAEGDDLKDECADGVCVTGACNGAGACGMLASGTDCGTCAACDGAGACVDDLGQDGDCGLCQRCVAGQACGPQDGGDDLKDECPAGACLTGACDGAGACGFEPEGADCGTCSACDGAGSCVDDLEQDADCPVCQVCAAGGGCTGQQAGDDAKDECDQDACNTGVCDGAGACGFEPGGTDCGTCRACNGAGDCIDDLEQHEDCPLCEQCAAGGTCTPQAAGDDLKAECADDVFCDGVEACDGSSACQDAGPDPCPELECDEATDQCVGCLDDADCPLCQRCDTNDTCVPQDEGDDLKDECPEGECLTGACNGAGACGFQPVDTPCGSDADTACDDPDSCNATGTCRPNYEMAGVPCPDSATSDCDDARCDGAGACDQAYQPEGAGYVCREASGDCDLAEQCDGASGGACPSDVLVDAGTECRAAPDLCDVPEQCDGANPDCPADEVADAGTECRGATGLCDLAEVCDGSAKTCPADAVADAGTECRAAPGACDIPEVCNGSSKTCPTDAVESAGTQCRASTDPDCDPAEVCDGTNPDCPSDAYTAEGTQCTDTDTTDCADARCDGNGDCDQTHAPELSSYVCRPAAGDCDLAEQCDGSNLACPGDVLVGAGTECRAAPGDCDIAESCDGSSPDCPEDEVVSGGTECRASSDPDCDPAEVCDGTNPDCPDDAFTGAGTQCTDDDTTDCADAQCDGSGACDQSYTTEGAGHVCRPSTGECDLEDTCNGSDLTCPADAYETDGSGCLGSDTNPCNSSCQSGVCDNGIDADPGEPCDDGIDCTSPGGGDVCDGAGFCSGTPDDSYCDGQQAGDLCWPGCSPDATGCVTPPGSMALVCDDPVDLPLTDVSNCSLTLSGGDSDGQESCLTCTADVGVTTLAYADFEDDDNPGACAPLVDGRVDGWKLVTDTRCYNDIGQCPLAQPDQRDCCDNVPCPLDVPGLEGTIALQAENSYCTGGDRQWRLDRTFDTTGLQDIQVCFDYADHRAGGNEQIQVDVADASGNTATGLYCDRDGPRRDVERIWYHTCIDLPAWANDNPSVTVSVFLHGQDNDRAVLLDNLSVRALATVCPATRTEIFGEDFSGCNDPLADGWNGWTVSGTINCITNFDCPDDSYRAEVDNVSGSFERYQDVTGHQDIRLCFFFGDDHSNNGDSLTVEMDPGTGWQEVWSLAGNAGPDSTCSRVCVNLSDLDAAVDFNPSLGIRFSLASDGDKLDLDEIVLEGAQVCAAGSSVVDLSSPLGSGGGVYGFTATDTAGSQLTAHIGCSWDPDPSLAASQPVSWLNPWVVPSNGIDPGLLCANPSDLVVTTPITIDTSSGNITSTGGDPPGDIVFNVVSQGGGAPDIGVFSFHDVDIQSEVTVVGSRALAIVACGDITVADRISACAAGPGNGPGGGRGGASESDGTGYDDGWGRGGDGQFGGNWWQSGGGGAGHGDVGGDGGDPDPAYQGGAGGQLYDNDALVPLLGGSGGGGGGCAGGGGGGLGGGGGGAVQLVAGNILEITPGGGVDACGAGGLAPSDDGCAGGGAGSGGAILIEALEVIVDGTLAANGGGGGGGDEYGGGLTATDGDPGAYGATRAAGGSGGGDGGDGGAGGAGTTPVGDHGEDTSPAGGGGGAAGRIRINSMDGTAGLSGTLSPDESTGLATVGTVEVW